MSALEKLPPDQHAVLQMVLQRGRSYDQIAALLSIERDAVRQRALTACEALAPRGGPTEAERAHIIDYLLGQLPAGGSEQVYARLRASETDRAWARALARILEPLASGALPEIPVGAPLGADAGPHGGLKPDGDPPHQQRPSSRRGGAILLVTLGALILAAIVVVIASSGGNGRAPRRPRRDRPSTAPQNAGTITAGTTGSSATTAVGTGTATGTTTASPQILAQLNLRSPTHSSATVGIVQVERVDGVLGIVIDAQGVPPNSKHNAYAVWLYNSPTSLRRLGFVPNLVGKDRDLVTDSTLPAGAVAYHRILITLETRSNPTTPGEVVLSGPFREHP